MKKKKKKKKKPQKETCCEKRLGNVGAVTGGTAFTIHFHGQPAQILQILLRRWTRLDIYFPTDDNRE